jgi:hypothetical protein
MRTRALVCSLVGPGAFASAAFAGARMVPEYRPRDEPISALAAHGMRSASVMVPGFLALALGTVALARELRGTGLAPAPVASMLAVAGLTVGGAGLARCSDRTCPTRWLGDEEVTRSDDVHAVTSAATFALWIAVPLVAARRGRSASIGARRASRALGLTTLASLLIGGRMAQRPSTPGSGTAQRIMLASVFAWYPLAALSAGNATRTR